MNREPTFVLPREAVEELNCPICMESKTLQVLPCQHRCCNECIENMAKHRRRINCPECRRELSIPVEGFPVCRLSEYFREKLSEADDAIKNQKDITCDFCHKEAEAKCSSCQQFICYRCVAKEKCTGANGKHMEMDFDDLAKQADVVIESWKKQVDTQLEILRTQMKDSQQKLNHKEEVQKVLENMLSPSAHRGEKIVFVDKMGSKGERKLDKVEHEDEISEEGEQEGVAASAKDLKTITMNDRVVAMYDCTSLCLASSGDIIVGTFLGHIMVYSQSEVLRFSYQTTGGAVWSLAEHNKYIYAQCGENIIEHYQFDLKALGSWKTSFTAGKIAVSNDSLYVSNPKAKCFAKYGLKGGANGVLTHPSFVYPYHVKSYRRDSLVVCDYKANAIFMFKNELCIWQLSVENCSAVAVDESSGRLWVKILNRRKISVISSDADRLGCIEIKRAPTVISYDMAVKNDKLYLATENGLLTTDTGSSVCTIL